LKELSLASWPPENKFRHWCGLESAVELSRIILWDIMVGPLAVLLAAALGCQPGTTADLPPSAFAKPAQGVNEEPAQGAVKANTSGPVHDDATHGSSEGDRGATETLPAGGPAVAASQRLSPQQHYEAGVAREQGGASSEAIAHYTAALELDPDFATARKRLGALLLAQKRFLDASILYGQLVESNPDNPDAHNDWGVVLVRIGDLREAIDQFREALRLKSDHPDAHYNLAAALLATGRVDKAKEHLIEALRIHPSYTDAYFALGRAYLQEDKLDEAIAQFEHVMRLARNYAGLHFQLGRVFMRKKDMRKAVQHFSEAVRDDPLHFEAHYALGLALAQYGNHQAAVAQFTEAVQLEPENPDAHFHLAQTQAQLGRVEESIFHNDMAITLRPEWPEALNNQAWLLATAADAKLRDPKRALALAERAKQLADYKMPLVLDTLAAAQAAMGEFEEAEENAAKALDWAETTNQTQVTGEIQERLEAYRARRAHFAEEGK
jgi:tetratricopeptide (TPR) repeat protein